MVFRSRHPIYSRARHVAIGGPEKTSYRAGNGQPLGLANMDVDRWMKGKMIGWQSGEGGAWVIRAWVSGGPRL